MMMMMMTMMMMMDIKLQQSLVFIANDVCIHAHAVIVAPALIAIFGAYAVMASCS